MELSEAIEVLKGLIEPQSYTLGSYDKEAIDTVITELNRLQKSEEDLMIKAGKITCEMSLEIDRLKEELTTRYNKGYQDGYNQGYLAGAMEII